MDGQRAVGVRADLAAGGPATFRADAVIDASGRDSFLASRLGLKRRDPDLNKIAIFTYYRGARRDPGLDAGATTVAYIPDKGWFWYIPLPDDIVSVGVVAEKDYLYRDTRDPEEIFTREAAACIWIADHLQTGTRVEPVRVTGEFSYRAETIGGDGYCLAGDAFAFLDPVFSTGLFMALKSGEMAADAVHQGLAAGGVTAATFEQYDRDMRWALDQFRQLVLSFYNERFSFREFIPRPPGPASAAGRCAGRQRLRRSRSAVRRTPRVLGAGLGITTWGCAAPSTWGYAPNPRQALGVCAAGKITSSTSHQMAQNALESDGRSHHGAFCGTGREQFSTTRSQNRSGAQPPSGDPVAPRRVRRAAPCAA